MIVKNEAHCIVQCLEKVKPYINYWVICDTGSTDNTIETIKKFMKDIPGEIHESPWQDFATNRNIALNISKDKAEYSLIMDADDHLFVEDNNAFKNLIEPAYYIQLRRGTLQYQRIQLVKNNLNAHYIGALHEYLYIPNIHVTTQLRGCYIQCLSLGARSQDPDKYKKDAEVLEREIIKDPDNPRNVFYCAQSYRDAGMLEKSLEKYLQRSKMPGWIEEQYISLLNAAKIIERLYFDDVQKVQEAYLNTYKVLSSRNEALCYLAAYCRRHQLFHLAYIYAKIGSMIEKPKDGLFVESDCYDWKIFDELSIAAFYNNQKEEFKKIINMLIVNQHVPELDKPRIMNNLNFV